MDDFYTKAEPYLICNEADFEKLYHELFVLGKTIVANIGTADCVFKALITCNAAVAWNAGEDLNDMECPLFIAIIGFGKCFVFEEDELLSVTAMYDMIVSENIADVVSFLVNKIKIKFQPCQKK